MCIQIGENHIGIAQARVQRQGTPVRELKVHGTGSGVQPQNAPIRFRDFPEPRQLRNDALSREVNASCCDLHHVPGGPTKHSPGKDGTRSRAQYQEGRKDAEKQRQSDCRSSIRTRVFGDVFSINANAAGSDVGAPCVCEPPPSVGLS